MTMAANEECAYPGDHEHDHEMCRDAIADRLDQWADGYLEPEYRTGADEVVYADESEYARED